MTVFRPSVAVVDNILHLRLLDTDPIRSVDIECVLDLTNFSEVVGVEVLDLRRQLDGGGVDPPSAKGTISWSYDDEIDAFYVRVGDGRGQVQRSATGTARLDSTERIVGFDVPLPSPADNAQ